MATEFEPTSEPQSDFDRVLDNIELILKGALNTPSDNVITLCVVIDPKSAKETISMRTIPRKDAQ